MKQRRHKNRRSSYGWIGLVLLLIVIGVAQTPLCSPEADAELTSPTDVGTDQLLIPSVDNGEDGGLVLRRTSYVVSYNAETRCPNWVAWQLTADHADGPLRRMSNFHEDDDCPQPRATLQDYRGSGWSRGHMCPAGDNKWSRQAMYDSFSLVNVCPQNAKLNSGVWNSIETDCRRWARQYGEVYIVCGPVWSRGPRRTIGANAVAVPDAFFKVVLRLSPTPQAFGIVVKNTEGTRKRDLYYNSVDQVERITGIDFFSALPDDVERQVEATADMTAW